MIELGRFVGTAVALIALIEGIVLVAEQMGWVRTWNDYWGGA